MSNIATQLAWAVCHPRAGRVQRRPVCDGSRVALAAGCVHDDHRAVCPYCSVPVTAERYLPRAVLLAVHPEVNR